MFIFLIISGVFLGVSSQLPGLGRCPQTKLEENFNVTAFQGKWYLTERSLPEFANFGSVCVTADINATLPDSISITYRKTSWITGGPSEMIVDASLNFEECEGIEGCAKFILTYPGTLMGTASRPYTVIGTDYTSYAVVHSCKSGILLTRTTYVIVLTRDKNPSASVLLKAHKTRDRSNLDGVLTYYRQNCP